MEGIGLTDRHTGRIDPGTNAARPRVDPQPALARPVVLALACLARTPRRVYEEMAASCVLIARKGAEVCRLTYADAHAVRHQQGGAR